MNKAQEVASVKHVFGEPTVSGERSVIPVAVVSYTFGFGWGGGPEQTDEQGHAVTTGSGAGAGGQVNARPVAVVELTPNETVVKPVQDGTRIAVAGMLLGGWALFQFGSTLRKLIGRRR